METHVLSPLSLSAAQRALPATDLHVCLGPSCACSRGFCLRDLTGKRGISDANSANMYVFLIHRVRADSERIHGHPTLPFLSAPGSTCWAGSSCSMASRVNSS